MATITVRALDVNGEPLFGNSRGNFVSDLEAVAQIIGTRLKLLQGEWWEDVNTGTPLFESMLGVSGAGKHPDAISLILKQRILGTPYVLSVANVTTSYDGDARAFTFSCSVATQFGALSVTNNQAPGLSASQLL